MDSKLSQLTTSHFPLPQRALPHPSLPSTYSRRSVVALRIEARSPGMISGPFLAAAKVRPCRLVFKTNVEPDGFARLIDDYLVLVCVHLCSFLHGNIISQSGLDVGFSLEYLSVHRAARRCSGSCAWAITVRMRSVISEIHVLVVAWIGRLHMQLHRAMSHPESGVIDILPAKLPAVRPRRGLFSAEAVVAGRTEDRKMKKKTSGECNGQDARCPSGKVINRPRACAYGLDVDGINSNSVALRPRVRVREGETGRSAGTDTAIPSGSG